MTFMGEREYPGSLEITQVIKLDMVGTDLISHFRSR